MGNERSGRPSKYQDTFAEQAGKMAQRGLTDAEIADILGISLRTIHSWKNEHEEFLHSLKTGKEEADSRVERSLYHRACGYEYDAVKIFMPPGADKPVYAPYREKMPPDTTACIFWLKNRKRDEWRDKVAVEHSVDESLAARLKRARENARNARSLTSRRTDE